MYAILSSPILVENGIFHRKTISDSDALAWVAKHKPVSFTDHQTVKILGLEPATTREQCSFYQEALIVSPRQRLEFGREYSKQEIEAIGVDFILIILLSVR